MSINLSGRIMLSNISSQPINQYTSGVQGTYNISIPNFLKANTGISLVVYISNNISSLTTLMRIASGSPNYYGPMINLNQNSSLFYQKGYLTYADNAGSSNTTWRPISSNSLKFDSWNTINIFNNNGTVEMRCNGTMVSKSTVQTNTSFVLSVSNYVVMGSMAYTKANNVSLPYSNNSGVISFIDFNNATVPFVYGDKTQLAVSSTSLTKIVPAVSLPPIS